MISFEKLCISYPAGHKNLEEEKVLQAQSTLVNILVMLARFPNIVYLCIENIAH